MSNESRYGGLTDEDEDPSNYEIVCPNTILGCQVSAAHHTP
jgi:hypothetical protein